MPRSATNLGFKLLTMSEIFESFFDPILILINQKLKFGEINGIFFIFKIYTLSYIK